MTMILYHNNPVITRMKSIRMLYLASLLFFSSCSRTETLEGYITFSTPDYETFETREDTLYLAIDISDMVGGDYICRLGTSPESIDSYVTYRKTRRFDGVPTQLYFVYPSTVYVDSYYITSTHNGSLTIIPYDEILKTSFIDGKGNWATGHINYYINKSDTVTNGCGILVDEDFKNKFMLRIDLYNNDTIMAVDRFSNSIPFVQL